MTWADHVPGFEQVMFPVLIDTERRTIHELYSATAYDVVLIDKQGNIAARFSEFGSKTTVPMVKAELERLLAQ